MKTYSYYKHFKVYTIKEILDFCCKKYGNKIAFIYSPKGKAEESISYIKFKTDVLAFGAWFFDCGYKDCNISVLGENSYYWILTHFAVTCGKNVIVPIDKDLEIENITELLINSESRVLVYSDTYADVAEQLQVKLPKVTFLNMKNLPEYIERGKQMIADGHTDYIDIEIDKDDLAAIVYTSGTTGKSKGVMLTHGNFAIDTYSACCNVEVYGSSILLLPLHHTFGLVAGVFSEMIYGYPIYISSSLKRVQQDLQIAKPQNLFAVPLMVETLYKNIWLIARKQGKERVLKILVSISNLLRIFHFDLRKEFFKPVLSAFGGNLDLIICGGAPLNPELVKGFDDFGVTVLNGYGITECAPIVAVNRNRFNVVGSVGLPLICNDVKIAEDGEVLVKGDNVMLGYYHNEVENEKVFVDGWFKTGDLGRIDEDGALYITGRIKNLIILGNGENIPAELLEERIYTIPYVKEVIVYGKDNMIIAEVYLDEEVVDAKERIHADIQLMNQQLPLTRNIGQIVIRDTEFPKTTTKKIKRNYGG